MASAVSARYHLGTMSKPRYILLDRDGTIIVERHYLSDPAGVELLPGTGEGMRRMAQLGYRFIVVTNQSGLARGYFDEPTLEAIHDRLRELLAAEDVTLDAVYYCPHLDDHGCDCRKPLAGMAKRAAADFDIDLSQTIVIGDKCADVGLGRAIGAATILVRTGHGMTTVRSGECHADYIADDLTDAAAWIERRDAI